MKNISHYINEPEGTGPATGKTFSLHGMIIGELLGAEGTNLVFKRGEEFMHVPIAIKLEGFRLPAPIPNPILEHIIEI